MSAFYLVLANVSMIVSTAVTRIDKTLTYPYGVKTLQVWAWRGKKVPGEIKNMKIVGENFSNTEPIMNIFLQLSPK